jgi:hypothetical protein
MPLTTFHWLRTWWDYGMAANAALFGAVTCAIALFLAVAQRRTGGSVAGALAQVPLAMGLLWGLSFAHTAALLGGLVHRDLPFVRTPKRGDASSAGVYRAPFDRLCLIEIAIGIAYAGFVRMAASQHLFAQALFFAFVGASYLWVGLASLGVHAPRLRTPAAPEPIAVFTEVARPLREVARPLREVARPLRANESR